MGEQLHHTLLLIILDPDIGLASISSVPNSLYRKESPHPKHLSQLKLIRADHTIKVSLE